MMAYNPFSRLMWLLTGMADLGPICGAVLVYLAVAAALWL